MGNIIAVHGREDARVCREAGTFWREETTDKFPSMRPKLDAALSEVADEFNSQRLTWCRRDVRRLIRPYPPRKKVDSVLSKLGEDFCHDDIHAMDDGDDDTAVAEGVEGSPSSSSDDGENTSGFELESTGMEIMPHEGANMEIEPLSASQADAVHHAQATMASLEIAIEGLRAIGNLRGVQAIESELSKERRRQRELVKESPAVADAFVRLRKAEDQEALMQKRAAAEQKDRKRAAENAMAERASAVADLKRVKQSIAEAENHSACRHAIKSYTVDALGGGNPSAGGVKGKKNRFEVLDRLSRFKAGLSAGQKNDWAWFKDAWDQEMVARHGGNWGLRFSEWMQGVLEDERSNAFSLFVNSETCRVFDATAALHVPGS